MIIGLVGKKGSGKTETAKYLCKKYGFKEIAFAEPVKEIVEIIYGFPYEILLGDTPEKREMRMNIRDPVWNMTAVQAMQFIGTELFRNNMDKDVWVKIAERKIVDMTRAGYSNIVISDCRFENEIDLIRRYGGKISVLYEDEKDLLTNTDGNVHSSENSFQSAIKKDDYRIHNTKNGLEDLYQKIDELVKNI